MPNPLEDWENLAVEILEHFRRRNIFWETTERRVSYHVFLPEDSFLSKILNVPLKKHPVPFTRSRCGRSARVYVCTARRRKKGTDRHVTFDANSSKCQIPAGTEAAGLEKERNRESCVPWSRRFDQWGTTRRRFAASSTTRSSFVSHPLLSPSPPSCHSLPCFFVRSIFPLPVGHSRHSLKLSIFLQRSRKGFLWEEPTRRSTWKRRTNHYIHTCRLLSR